jgi:hypothetical protein
MEKEILYRRNGILVWRARLEPGESSEWHVDTCERITVIVSGDRLAIEYRDGSQTEEFTVGAGQVDVGHPSDRAHRAVNVGGQRYDEVVTFFLDHEGQDPQPPAP